MTPQTNLGMLLRSLSPSLVEGEFVFCTFQNAHYGDYAELSPIAAFGEPEGLTVVISKVNADRAGLSYDSVFRCITLTVHSSLDAVGLTAAVSSKLAGRGISANVFAGYHHDHVFVPAPKANAALAALMEFTR
jgi:hypothetical protein